MPTWSSLMTVKGAQLWSARNQVLQQSQHKLRVSRDRKQGFVKLLCHPSALVGLEAQRGLDKIPLTIQDRKALTMTVGEEWTRQRSLICTALIGIPKLSLEACKVVDWRKVLALSNISESKNSVNVDLKEVIVQTTVDWNTALFVGNKESTSELSKTLKTSSLEYWRQTRALVKNKGHILLALQTLEESLPWNNKSNADLEFGGVLKNLHESGLGPRETTDNAINAVIASIDAVQSLVFWTLWNLSRTTGAWEACEATSDQQYRNDLVQLSIFKKQSTQGQSVELEGLSYMGRALVETVRVYPPVWTLPRNWHDKEFVSSKFDILSCNHATARNWKPASDTVSGTTVASFGLGKRHCPAATAGLYAAYDMILKFVKTCKAINECEPEKALNYCYLGPTLCVHGPQMFRVTLQGE